MTYSTEQVLAMTKPELQTLCTTLEIVFKSRDSKASLLEQIYAHPESGSLIQDEMTVGTEDQDHPDEPSYEYLEPVEESDELEDEPFAPGATEYETDESDDDGEAPWTADPIVAVEETLQTSEQTYEERLLLFLDRHFSLDDDAEYLLRNFSNLGFFA